MNLATEGKVKYGIGKNPNSHRNGFKLGHQLSEESRKKISETLKRIGVRPPSQKGVRYSNEYKKKMSQIAKERGFGLWSGPHWMGERNPNWKGGVCPENLKIRNTPEYRKWRKAVFERDNYTCQICHVRSGGGKAVFLNAHHIKGFARFPELRFELTNGITLCRPCHERIDPNRGRRKKKVTGVSEKPWGCEDLWALTDRYASKFLHIRKDESLSWQYHLAKEETIYVLSGILELQLSDTDQPNDITVMKADTCCHIPPRKRHRMTALTDCIVIEVSTPELDDVVRIEDRYGRRVDR